MKFLLSPFGSHGDVHPFLGIGVELQKRGYEVKFAVNEFFRELTEATGLPYVEMGEKKLYTELSQDSRIWNPRSSFQVIFREGVAKILTRHIEWIRDEYVAGETVVLSSIFGFGARVAQEAFGVPLTTIHLQPAVLWSEHDSPQLPNMFSGPSVPRWLKRLQIWVGEKFVIDRAVRPVLNPVLEQYHCPPMRNTLTWMHSPTRIIGMFPEWFAPVQPDWPTQTRLADFPLWDEADLGELPPEQREFLKAGDPPIIFAPGSAMRHGKPFFEAAAAACEAMNRRGILLTRFPEQIPQGLPQGVVHFAYSPFSRILPFAAMLVHHGGIGSTAQTMAAGIPQLIMPMSHDQFDNANRVRRLGVGDEIARSRFTAARLCEMVPKLLDSSEVEKSCQKIRQRFTGRGGIEQAVDIIESDLENDT